MHYTIDGMEWAYLSLKAYPGFELEQKFVWLIAPIFKTFQFLRFMEVYQKVAQIMDIMNFPGWMLKGPPYGKYISINVERTPPVLGNI